MIITKERINNTTVGFLHFCAKSKNLLLASFFQIKNNTESINVINAKYISIFATDMFIAVTFVNHARANTVNAYSKKEKARMVLNQIPATLAEIPLKRNGNVATTVKTKATISDKRNKMAIKPAHILATPTGDKNLVKEPIRNSKSIGKSTTKKITHQVDRILEKAYQALAYHGWAALRSLESVMDRLLEIIWTS